jgi:hypothetical protein
LEGRLQKKWCQSEISDPPTLPPLFFLVDGIKENILRYNLFNRKRERGGNWRSKGFYLNSVSLNYP